MRVVLLNQYYAPDEAPTAQLLTDLGQHLAGAGHSVRAICSSRSYSDPSRRSPRREQVCGVDVLRTWTTGFGRRGLPGRALDYLSYLVGAGLILVFQRRFDVVISLSTPPMVASVGLVLSRLRRARSLYWVMDVYPDVAFELGVLRRRGLPGWLLARLSRFTLRGSDAVVALGETMAKRLALSGARPTVIHNWADGETIRPRPVTGHELRAEWGWEDRFVVLYSGNLGLAHEFETVLDAAEILRDHPSIRFAFVGDGPRRRDVERECDRRGLSNLEFRPSVDRERLGSSLTAGDVHLVTLRAEVAGLLVPSKIYGILAAGRPTVYVGPARGEVADILREGRCGTRVAEGQADELARTLLDYERDGRRREAEGRRAREMFDERFTRERALDAFARLIVPGPARAGNRAHSSRP